MGRHIKHFSKSQLQRRQQIEAELSAIPAISASARKLTSADGFVDYFLEMQDLYSSQREAYERLEDFHIEVTGQRKYSEYDSFRKILGRYLDNYTKTQSFSGST